MKLTMKQKLFVDHYLSNGFNATKAAISAGYSEKTATLTGHENLTKPYIKKIITDRTRELLSDTEALTLQWLEQVKAIAMFDMRKAATWDADGVDFRSSEELDDITAKAIQEVSQDGPGKIKIKAADKNKALDLLGKYLAILSDHVPEYEDKPTAAQLDAKQRRERIAELSRKLHG